MNPERIPAGQTILSRQPDRIQPRADSMPMGVPLAMVYAPLQRFDFLYSPQEALSRGTLFRELDQPFFGGKRQIG